MFDSRLRPIIDPPLNKLATALHARGVRANMVTGIGFGFAVLSFVCLIFQSYNAAIVLIVLSRLMDGLDGPLARQSQATDIGGYFDIVADFIFYSGVVFFFALGRPDHALAAAFLIFSFMGTGTSFLAYAIIAVKRGVVSEHQGKKSFYYLSGITEGAETIAALVLICLLPDWFSQIAIFYGILCWLTILGRVRAAIADFS